MSIKPVFLFRNVGMWMVVTVKHWDYKTQDCRWMADDDIGPNPFIMQVDVIDDMFRFYNEQDALRKVAELYTAQLKGE